MRIVIVEDDEALRLVYRATLEKIGVEVTFADRLPDLQQAISGADMVISDRDMGFDVNDVIALAESKNVPLLVCTGSNKSVYRNQLDKPFGVGKFLENVRRVFNEHASTTGSGKSFGS